jgi:NAD(P)-dependent dehydrogenase (short-subunit alcohol dehydrogenase family)
MLAFTLATPALSLKAPPTPAALFKSVETAVYTADRARDELLNGVKRVALDGDALSALSPAEFALDPSTSTCCVTGATDGIGKEAALFLAKEGFGVILCARDTAKAAKTVEYIKDKAVDARVAVVALDLSSVASVEAAAPLIVDAAAELGSPLKGLMLNAGVWPGTLQTTGDGMELALQACHIGHQQLTQRLLPTLEASAGETRVVTTSSSAHAFASEMGLDDPAYSGESKFDTNSNYGRAKFANMLFAQELAQRTRSSGVRSIATHPGVVLTTLFKELGPDYQASSGGGLRGKSAVEDRLDGIPALRTIREATPLKVVLKSPEEGCRPLLYSLLAPGLPSGGYVVDCALTDISPASKSLAARQELWGWTERWVEAKLGSAVQEEQEASTSSEAATDEAKVAAEVVAVDEDVTPSGVVVE